MDKATARSLALQVTSLQADVIERDAEITRLRAENAAKDAEIEERGRDLIWALANRARLWVDDGPLGSGQRNVTWCDLADFHGEIDHDGTDADIRRAVREARLAIHT